MVKRAFLYFFLIISLFSSVFAQTNPDSARPLDSLNIGKEEDPFDIIFKNKESKVNQFLEKILKKRKKDSSNDSILNENENKFVEVEGKIIRNIYINSHKPFGYSLADSTKRPEKFIEKAGNSVHVKTREFVIKNYLLLKEGEAFDSLKIAESERLIRGQRFIRKVEIKSLVVETNSDSVDLFVNTLDSWAIFPSMTYSGSKVGFRLRSRNFLGMGHDFDNYYRQNFETGDNKFQTRYTMPNIRNTFIGLSVGYSSNEENEYSKGVILQRRFFSPLIRWAGGVSVIERAYLDSIPNSNGAFAQNFKYNLKDFWGGYAFRLSNIENTNKYRLTNLIVSARYFNVDYIKRPELSLDPNRFYANEDFFLLGLELSRRGFVQDRFIQNYDIVEDIPVGFSMGLTTGIQRKNNRDRFYLAGRVKMGNYFDFGYLGFNLGYGGYRTSKGSEQTVFSLGLNYFTRLINIGEWKLRNFISSHLIIGHNRANSRGDRLTLNENDPLGIDGFYSLDVIGIKKWLTNIQAQSYSPYSLLGFRISPIFSSSFGLISDENESVLSGKLYARIGLGVLLTNDYFVFNRFELSLSWYNNIPGHGDNIFKTNTYHMSDYNLMDFDYVKPELIDYNPYVIK